jgi:UDP-N-acetylglucosamine acyltransferase
MTHGSRVDPTAVVDPEARLGEGVSIGPLCVVGPQVRLGDRCRLVSQVSVQGPTEIGPDTVISPMASIGGPPQDLKFKGGESRLEVGARNTIREFVTFNRGTEDGGGVTLVGDDNLFMAYSHVAHDCRVGNRTIFANGATLAGHVEVGDEATVGAFSAVHQFCRVANQAFIGGYSVVTRDALPWVTTVGNRAKSYGLNLVGLKRKGYSEETIAALKTTYNRLFKSKLLLEEAMESIDKELGHVEEVRYFLDFVRGSKRGVVR